MRRFLPFGMAVAFLCEALGCGKNTGTGAPREYEAIYKDEWQASADVVAALESVKDKNSAKAAAARINAACDRLEELHREAQKAPQMSPEGHQKMVDTHLDEWARLGVRLVTVEATALRNSEGELEFGKAYMRYQKKPWLSGAKADR